MYPYCTTTRKPVSPPGEKEKAKARVRVSHDSSFRHAVWSARASSNGLHLSEDTSGCPPSLWPAQWTKTHEDLVEVASCQKIKPCHQTTAIRRLLALLSEFLCTREPDSQRRVHCFKFLSYLLPAAEGDAHTCGTLLGCLLL